MFELKMSGHKNETDTEDLQYYPEWINCPET
jgi:hypothetical protein